MEFVVVALIICVVTLSIIIWVSLGDIRQMRAFRRWLSENWEKLREYHLDMYLEKTKDVVSPVDMLYGLVGKIEAQDRDLRNTDDRVAVVREDNLKLRGEIDVLKQERAHTGGRH